MKKIKLTQNQFAVVDDIEFDYLNQWKWHAVYKGNSYYAVRKQYLRTIDGKEEYDTVYMARLIMDTPNNMLCDHIDGNGLNNQSYNLRNCTKAQNQRNRGPQKNNTSGHKNVYWHKQVSMWRVRFKAGKVVRGSLHHNIEDAVIERDQIVKEMHGAFGRTEAFNV